MAIRFRPLPLEVFTEAQRPYIAHMNTVLRELTALEGVIRHPRSEKKRSDATVARATGLQVDVSRITPSVAQVVSGQSTVVGTPALVLGTVNTKGTTATAVSVNSSIALFGTQTPRNDATSAAVGSSAFAARADHVHRFPVALESSTNNTTLTLTDNSTDQTLTGVLGSLSLSSSNHGVNLDYFTGAGGTPFLNTALLSFSTGASTVGGQLNTAINGLVKWDDATSYGATHRGILLQVQELFTGGAVYTNETTRGEEVSVTAGNPTSGTHTWTEFTGYRLNVVPPKKNTSTGVTVIDSRGLHLVGWPGTLFTAGSYTNAYAADLLMPNIGDTIRRGVYLRVAGTGVGTAPTNEEGFYCDQLKAGTGQRTSYYAVGMATGTPSVSVGFYADAHTVGTSRYAFYGVSDTLYHGGKFQHGGLQLGLHGATPSSQFGNTGTANGFAAGTSTAVTVDSTFTGNTGSLAYTFGDIVQALKQKGIIAY